MPDEEQRFEAVVADLLGERGVTPPRGGSGFGRTALRVDGRFFAMLARGSLVVKLPKARVDDLVEAGEGTRFGADTGRPRKEWLSLGPSSQLDWTTLAREALEFVRG